MTKSMSGRMPHLFREPWIDPQLPRPTCLPRAGPWRFLRGQNAALGLGTISAGRLTSTGQVEGRSSTVSRRSWATSSSRLVLCDSSGLLRRRKPKAIAETTTESAKSAVRHTTSSRYGHTAAWSAGTETRRRCDNKARHSPTKVLHSAHRSTENGRTSRHGSQPLPPHAKRWLSSPLR